MSLFRDKIYETIRDQRAKRSPGRASGAPGLNALVMGSGGREYAIAWSLARANSIATIDTLPGNAGLSLFTRLLDFEPTDLSRLEQHVAAAHIDLAIVGPDELVAAGLGDSLRRTGISVVAPSREAARIEWSKSFAKELMDETGVPTAAWKAYPNAERARAALEERDGPVVVKADGLAAGKGVAVARDRSQAIEALGTAAVSAGAVVLEDLLEGEEASLQTLVDGETVVALPPARDYKRVGDGDAGPNTGGMGAYSPSEILPDDEAQGLADQLVAPVARALVRRGTPYRGVLYAGLMRTAGGWRVLEYNARFGDPEAEVTIPRIDGDFGRLMFALGEGRLAEHVGSTPMRFSDRAYVDLVLCSEGYPAKPKTGELIEGLGDLPEGVYAFHGATRRVGERFVTAGGRVIHLVASGDSVADARRRAYDGASRIQFKGKFHRSDIASAGTHRKLVGAV